MKMNPDSPSILVYEKDGFLWKLRIRFVIISAQVLDNAVQ